MHNEAYLDGEHVIYETSVCFTNTTDEDLWGYAIADVREDRRAKIVTENFTYAYEEDNYNKELIFIEANSSKTYGLYFKPLRNKSSEYLKMDREPPENIIFEVVAID